MQDLVKQEQFELEVLDSLNSGKFLGKLVFGGGTMLRLCYGLNRFSIDLDFWIVKKADKNKLFSNIKKYLERFYEFKNATNKFYTILFEIKSKDYPGRLKIEIRKEPKKITTEQTIAYSRFSNTQVFLNAVSLKDMMRAKTEAFLDRKEIRDVFDMEFLLKRGVALEVSREESEEIIKTIGGLSREDYTVKLGSLLEEGERKYYTKENFKILKAEIQGLDRSGKRRYT